MALWWCLIFYWQKRYETKGIQRDQQRSAVYEVLLSAMNDTSQTRIDHLVEGCGSIENMTTVRRESITGSGMYPCPLPRESYDYVFLLANLSLTIFLASTLLLFSLFSTTSSDLHLLGTVDNLSIASWTRSSCLFPICSTSPSLSKCRFCTSQCWPIFFNSLWACVTLSGLPYFSRVNNWRTLNLFCSLW